MLQQINADKTTNAKGKVLAIAEALKNKKVNAEDIFEFCAKEKEVVVANCVEAFEIISREKPELISKEVIAFVSKNLAGKAPRLKWESAKVLGNAAAKHVNEYNDAIPLLIDLTEFEGTVVRWSAAYAISAIVLLKSNWQAELIKLCEHLAEHEEKESIAKMYKKSLKELAKKK